MGEYAERRWPVTEPILFIAPTANLAKLAAGVIAEAGLSVPVEVGNYGEAPAAAAKYPDAGVIISRGGTAEQLKQLTRRTIIELRRRSATFSRPFTASPARFVRGEEAPAGGEGFFAA